MEQSKIFSDFKEQQANFINAFTCRKCVSTFHDDNKAVFLGCCKTQICNECALTYNNEVGLCPQCNLKKGEQVVNYEITSQIDQLMRNSSFQRNDIYKLKFRIGLLPNKIMIEYFQFYFFKNFKFSDPKKYMQRFVMNSDDDSLLKQQYIEIEMRKDYYYLKVLTELKGATLRHDDIFYILVQPKDDKLRASDNYRKSLVKKQYDLVAVAQNYPLEPNFIVLLDLPEDIEIGRVSDFLISNYQQEHGKFKIVKEKESSHKFCNLIIDFKENYKLCDSFAKKIQEEGLSLSQDQDMSFKLEGKPHDYYRYLFKTNRDPSKWKFNPRYDNNQGYDQPNNNYFNNLQGDNQLFEGPYSRIPNQPRGTQQEYINQERANTYYSDQRSQPINYNDQWGSDADPKFQEPLFGYQQDNRMFNSGRGARYNDMENRQNNDRFGGDRGRGRGFNRDNEGRGGGRGYNRDNEGRGGGRGYDRDDQGRGRGRGNYGGFENNLSDLDSRSNFNEDRNVDRNNFRDNGSGRGNSFGRGEDSSGQGRGQRQFGRGEEREFGRGQDRGFGRGQDKGFGRGQDNGYDRGEDRGFRGRGFGRGEGRGSGRGYEQREDRRKSNSRENNDFNYGAGRGRGSGRGNNRFDSFKDEEMNEKPADLEQSRVQNDKANETFSNAWAEVIEGNQSDNTSAQGRGKPLGRGQSNNSQMEDVEPTGAGRGRGRGFQGREQSSQDNQSEQKDDDKKEQSNVWPETPNSEDVNMSSHSSGRGQRHSQEDQNKDESRGSGRGSGRGQNNQSENNQSDLGRGSGRGRGRGNMSQDDNKSEEDTGEGRGRGRGRGAYGRGSSNDYGEKRDFDQYSNDDRGRGRGGRGNYGRDEGRFNNYNNDRFSDRGGRGRGYGSGRGGDRDQDRGNYNNRGNYEQRESGRGRGRGRGYNDQSDNYEQRDEGSGRGRGRGGSQVSNENLWDNPNEESKQNISKNWEDKAE